MNCVIQWIKRSRTAKTVFRFMKAAPQHFYQVYTVHGMVGTTSVPLAYFLLPNKTGPTYERTFRILREEIADVLPHGTLYDGPQHPIVDFEPAPIKAFQKIFDKTDVCSISDKTSTAKFRKPASDYATDLTFNLHCKMFLATAFVPPAYIKDAWLALEAYVDWTVKKDGPLARYFVETYIGALKCTGGQKPLVYGNLFWNCFARVRDATSRTTHPSEAWHNVFGTTVGCVHAVVYDFLQKLLGENAQQELLLHKLEIGEPPRKRKLAYENLLSGCCRLSANTTKTT